MASRADSTGRTTSVEVEVVGSGGSIALTAGAGASLMFQNCASRESQVSSRVSQEDTTLVAPCGSCSTRDASAHRCCSC